MSVVFGIQEPRPFFDRVTGVNQTRDFSSANRYGPIKFLLNVKDSPSDAPGPCTNKIITGLREYTEGDYLMFSGGDPIGLWLACAALNALGFRESQFLKWDRERDTTGKVVSGSGFYTPVTLPTRAP